MGPVKGTMVKFIATINTSNTIQWATDTTCAKKPAPSVICKSHKTLNPSATAALLNNLPSNQLQETWKMYYDAMY